jgi:hypothetical protein
MSLKYVYVLNRFEVFNSPAIPSKMSLKYVYVLNRFEVFTSPAIPSKMSLSYVYVLNHFEVFNSSAIPSRTALKYVDVPNRFEVFTSRSPPAKCHWTTSVPRIFTRRSYHHWSLAQVTELRLCRESFTPHHYKNKKTRTFPEVLDYFKYKVSYKVSRDMNKYIASFVVCCRLQWT